MPTLADSPEASREGARIEALRLRRARQRHAPTASSHARLPAAIAAHLVEHLEPIRLEPSVAVQIGADPGGLSRRLRERYPKAQLIVVDDCPAALRGAVPRTRWPLPPRAYPLAAHPTVLPLAGAGVDLLCSNLALGLLDDIPAVLKECRRVLRPGALLMLSFPGPDSFRELREAWSAVDRAPHLHPFPDMHEVGDALERAGFSDTVVDTERLQVEFDDLDHLLRELRAIGGGNAARDRRRGLTPPGALRRLRDAYPRPAPGAPLRASLEVGYAHAWVTGPRAVEVALPGR